MGQGNKRKRDKKPDEPDWMIELRKLNREKFFRESKLYSLGYEIAYINGNMYYRDRKSGKNWTNGNLHYDDRKRLIVEFKFSNADSKIRTDYAYTKGDYRPFFGL